MEEQASLRTRRSRPAAEPAAASSSSSASSVASTPSPPPAVASAAAGANSFGVNGKPAVVFLGEEVSRRKLQGSAAAMAGVLAYSLAKVHADARAKAKKAK